jgi:pimeloyl-ACP methyl ester carboxylesterase
LHYGGSNPNWLHTSGGKRRRAFVPVIAKSNAMTHHFQSGPVRIAFDDLGKGEPILLLHGFAADRRLNWRTTGWYDLLVKAGFRVIAADARGHGQSDKLSDPADYRPAGIAGDTIRLMNHLKIRKAHLFGYSMGGRNAAWLLYRYPGRFLTGIIGGAGLNVLKVTSAAEWESRGFRITADNRKTKSLAIPSMEKFYQRATGRGGRLGALAACLLGSFPSIEAKAFERVRAPVMVICGEKDATSGSPIPLAEAIPNARAVVIPGKSHVSAMTDPFFKGAVMGFLGNRWDRPRTTTRR